MSFGAESAAPEEVPVCPWGYEMMDATATWAHADGRELNGRLVQWDPAGNRCMVRVEPAFTETMLPLTRIRELTLTDVMPPGSALGGMGWGEPEAAAEGLSYRFELEGGEVFSGIAVRHVARPEGHYLNIRISEAGAFIRSFIGARFVVAAEVGAVRQELAGGPPPAGTTPAPSGLPAPGALVEPVRSASALREAVKVQASQPVRKLGDMLVSLQLISVEQLARVLAQGMGNGALPLGERLVRMGMVSPEGLQRALHLKMGYPLVDLQRFDFDRALLKRLPRDRASQLSALPLAMSEDGRLIVALDDPGNSAALQAMRFVYGLPSVVALPGKGTVRMHIARAYGVGEIADSGFSWGR